MKPNNYEWSDNPTVSGVSKCNTDVLNDCLMHLKYNNYKGDGLPLFTAMAFDHILTGDEAKGWAIQGSIVTMSYPDAVNKIIDEYEKGEDLTYRGVDCKKASNGHFIADISSKDAVDELYETSGVSDFYVLDSVNKCFHLPKNKYFWQFTDVSNDVNNFIEAGLPNIVGTFPTASIWGTPSGVFKFTGGTGEQDGDGDGSRGRTESFDASRSSAVYGKSSTVQPPSSIKLLYYKVGETFVNESEIDVSNLANDILNKVEADLSNCTKPYVTETYKNGASWYRVWSDGWIEQGGRFSGYNAAIIITFLKPFSNTDYSINQGEIGRAGADPYINGVYYCSLLNNQVTAILRNDGNNTYMWQACGK